MVIRTVNLNEVSPFSGIKELQGHRVQLLLDHLSLHDVTSLTNLKMSEAPPAEEPSEEPLLGVKNGPTSRARNGKLKPCYLVVQPTMWCNEYKHITNATVAWRQCEYHFAQKDFWALCPLDERHKEMTVLPYDHVYAPGPPTHYSSSQDCSVCQDIYANTQLMQWKNELDPLLRAMRASELTPEEFANLEQRAAPLVEAMRPTLEQYDRDNTKRMMEWITQSYERNPPLKIHTGRVSMAEHVERPQHPRPVGVPDIEILEHEDKRMHD